ncbi:MAG: hypothetical protein A3J74_05540 [Elusimicrobia bacterium RIFCSPHIGHO2_02_FULL_57_9]|nr:MAG: hypothetical protein A3J74_05540 [Elusimicrobia bacterium RIFCSPHIGHO2_02_FULL_57_9]
MLVTPGYFDEHGRAPITGLAINSIPTPDMPGTLFQDSKSHGISLGHARQAAVNSLMKVSWGVTAGCAAWLPQPAGWNLTALLQEPSAPAWLKL